MQIDDQVLGLRIVRVSQSHRRIGPLHVLKLFDEISRMKPILFDYCRSLRHCLSCLISVSFSTSVPLDYHSSDSLARTI